MHISHGFMVADNVVSKFFYDLNLHSICISSWFYLLS